jgi:lycopene beta-cyclase
MVSTPTKSMALKAVALRGLGMAGLSMATQLRARLPALELKVCDPRQSYTHDRSFAYFAVHPHQFESAVSHRYPRVSVFARDAMVMLDLRTTPYCLIPADQLYQAAFAAIGSFERVAQCPPELLCFDSRPPESPAALWQTFSGGEYQIQARTPLALDCAVLMDFRIAQAGAIRFVYLLPLTPERVLVQDTWISSSSVAPDFSASEAALRAHLERYFDIDLGQCLRPECGAIPMAAKSETAQIEVTSSLDCASFQVPIGARAGWLRAATGYSFLETQRGAAQLCDWYCAGAKGTPPLRTRSRLSDHMDTLFLRALRHRPEQAADWFFALFKHAPTSALVRFLAGTANTREHAQVALSLPVVRFLTALRRP